MQHLSLHISVYVCAFCVFGHSLVPCLAMGFDDLQKRIQKQDETAVFYQKQLEVCIVFHFHHSALVLRKRYTLLCSRSRLQELQKGISDMKSAHEVTTKVDIAGGSWHFWRIFWYVQSPIVLLVQSAAKGI